MRLSRDDRSLLAEWWFTVDRVLLAALLLLMAVGAVLSLAGSPSVAIRKGLPTFYFFERHVAFAATGFIAMIAASFLSPRGVRRLALVLFLLSVAGMAVVLFAGEEINGARRWLRIAGLSLQPSEFGKPGLAVLSAWAFAETERRPDMPTFPLAMLIYLMFAAPLVLQPDVGQTILVSVVWLAILVLSGSPARWWGSLLALCASGLGAAYMVYPHVRSRIDRHLAGPAGDNSQVERAIQSFIEGGFLGRGPGEGTIKLTLPDAHTDFVFATIAEEYGAVACLGVVILLAIVVLRPLARAIVTRDGFIRNSLAALSLLVGLQALINIGVNVGLLPAKGMTLPFVSSGGSSTIATSITCGMLLAMSRRMPDAMRLKLPEMPVTADLDSPFPSRTNIA